MAIERRNEFCKVCRIAFGLTCNGLTPNHLTFGEVYIKKLGLLKSDDFRVKEIIARILKDRKNTPDTLFESLEKGIKTINGGKIFCQIQSLYNPRMCVLLVGKEDDLIKGVVSYIYNIFGGAGFVSQNYSGWSDRDIVIHYKPLFDSYLNRGITIFLRGLENLSQDELKHMAAKIDDQIDGRWGGGRGILIIGTDDIASLPEYFVRQFEIVNLETEKQSKAIGISQTKNESGKQANNKPNIVPITISPGTKWEYITIHFTDKENVQILIKDASPIKRHLAEMGLNSKFLLAKIILYFAIAENKSLKPKIFDDITSDLKSQISDLRQTLRSLFIYPDGNSISGDPFPWDNNGQCYKPGIKLTSTSDVKAHLKSLLENQNTPHYETRKENPQKTSRTKGLKLTQDSEGNNDYQHFSKDSD